MNLVELFIPDPIQIPIPTTDQRHDLIRRGTGTGTSISRLGGDQQGGREEENAQAVIDVNLISRVSDGAFGVGLGTGWEEGEETEGHSISQARVARWARGTKSRGNGGRPIGQTGRIWELVEQFRPSDSGRIDGHEDRRGRETKKFSAIELTEWEREIVGFEDGGRTDPPAKRRRLETQDPEALFDRADPDLERGDWLNDIVMGPRQHEEDHGSEEEEDERMEAFEEVEDEEEQSYRLLSLLASTKPDPETGKPLDILNLSNDHLYVAQKAVKVKMATSLATVEIQHSKPALDLQMPFYRVHLTANDKRNAHRHHVQFPINIPLTFEKLLPGGRPQKNKTAKLGGSAQKPTVGVPASTKELTMADRHPIVLFEYSEQRPPVMSSYGMGSVITNYYRKKDEQDESFTQPNTLPSYNTMLYPGAHNQSHPKRNLLGQLSVLHPGDTQPYPLAFINNGEYYQSLESNLTRAPIYEQKPEPTDFLVIRQTEEGKQPKHFIKAIDNLFVVGQTYPRIAVPTPTSNEVRDARKKRLYDTIRRLLKKSKDGVVRQRQLSKHFPARDLHIILRIFMNQSMGPRNHKDRRWELMAPDEPVAPNKKPLDNIEDKVFTPEEHALLQSTDVASQLLEDAGYRMPATAKEEKLAKKKADMIREANEGGDSDEPGSMPLEMQLAPWYTTANYFKAAAISYQGGAFQPMLELSGAGDPTGRREGFSMLEKFKKQAMSEYGDWIREKTGRNKLGKDDWAMAYKEEQEDIWNRQRWALSNPIPPALTEEDEWEDESDEEEALVEAASGDSMMMSRRNSTNSFSGHPYQAGKAPSKTNKSTTNIPKILRIKRRDEDGEMQEEIIRDETIITAYLMQKATIDPIAVTSLIAQNPVRLSQFKDHLESYAQTYQDNEERKKQAEAQKEEMKAKMGGETKRGGPKRPPTCQECGQVGHTKKQKSLCPGRPKGFVPLSTPGLGIDNNPLGSASAASPVSSGTGTGGQGLKLKIGLGRKNSHQ